MSNDSNNSMPSITTSVVSCSMLIEALITYFNQFFISGNFQWQTVTSVVFGIIIALLYNIDLTEYFKISSKVPYVGSVITGILLSRGSNYVYDLLSVITKMNIL